MRFIPVSGFQVNLLSTASLQFLWLTHGFIGFYSVLSSISLTLSMLSSTVVSSMMNMGAVLVMRSCLAISFCAVGVWSFIQVTLGSSFSRFFACTHLGHWFLVMAIIFMFPLLWCFYVD
jgi:hypothetical protein